MEAITSKMYLKDDAGFSDAINRIFIEMSVKYIDCCSLD